MWIEHNVSPFVISFSFSMYTNQYICETWKNSLSTISADQYTFSRLQWMISGHCVYYSDTLLFTLYIDMLFLKYNDLVFRCHVGPVYDGSFGYTDDFALV